MIESIILTQPSSEPITLTEAKNYLKQNYTSMSVEDDLVNLFISAARQLCEGYINRSIARKEYRTAFDINGTEYLLPWTPIEAKEDITECYLVDKKGTETDLTLNDSFFITGLSDRKIVINNSGNNTTLIVEYYSGYTDVPAAIKMAILKQMAELYYTRTEGESESMMAAGTNLCKESKMLLYPYRKVIFF